MDSQNVQPPPSEPLPELVFAIVRALGTDVSDVIDTLETALTDARYKVMPAIRLSEEFKNVGFLSSTLKNWPEDSRYKTYMNCGDLLRSATQRKDAAAVLGVKYIRALREESISAGDPDNGKLYRGRAYIIRSLMHPGEVATLRRIYGPQLFILSVFAPEEERQHALSRKFAESRGEEEKRWRPKALEFLNRDVGINDPRDDIQKTIRPGCNLDVGRTYDKGDLFVSTTAPDEAGNVVERLVDLIFNHPFHTPTKEEYGMSIAFQSALCTSFLARRVGAAIMGDDGTVVSSGSNEVPRFGGGQYWPGDNPDGRDVKRGYDASDRIRRDLLADLLRRMWDDRSWIDSEKFEEDDVKKLNELVDKLDFNPTLKRLLGSRLHRKAQLFDVVEFGRAVHAEMAAITNAARRGISINRTTLYGTTFPCHNCASHIVASGIGRVVYIEPYPKSRVADLYPDSIGLGDCQTELGNRVRFEPFVGISPHRHADLFSWVPRKKDDLPGAVPDFSGKKAPWTRATSSLRDTIMDAETIDSGARMEAIMKLECREIEAFDHRLAKAEEDYKGAEDSS